jgi:hypothetical protein
VDFSWNPQYEPTFEFFDQALMDEVRVREDPDVEEFFRLLALCHTVMPEEKNGEYAITHFQASCKYWC